MCPEGSWRGAKEVSLPGPFFPPFFPPIISGHYLERVSEGLEEAEGVEVIF